MIPGRPLTSRTLIAALLAAALAACTPPPSDLLLVPTAAAVPDASPALTPTAALTATPLPALTATLRPPRTPPPTASAAPNLTVTPTATATPDPLAPYTIDALAARVFGESDILVRTVLNATLPFHQYIVEYESDGIPVTALANIPYGDGPFPVLIVLHGYIPPEEYYPGLDSRTLGDPYALAGYAVFMPDYRGYAGAAGGPNPLRIPYAVDVLNLIESLDTLDVLDEERVGVIGHSMGGGVASYVMVLSERVDAVVLYGSMSADQAVNWRYIGETWAPWWMELTAAQIGTPETNPQGYHDISPIHYLDRVRAPVQIHHGDHDDQVPVEWSRDLAERLAAAGVEVTYYEYPFAGHTFTGRERELLLERTLAFFDEHVRGDDPAHAAD
ncbi:MAG: hypothetical protein Kow00124_30180 [Anaerolineae bacterium]